MKPCSHCNVLVMEDEAHWDHEPECRNWSRRVPRTSCDCDLLVHPECCVVCKAEQARHDRIAICAQRLFEMQPRNLRTPWSKLEPEIVARWVEQADRLLDEADAVLDVAEVAR